MSLGLRELVWLAVGLLGLYVLMQLGRVLGLRRATAPEPEPERWAPVPDPEVPQLRREVAMLREELASADDAWQDAHRRLEDELLRLRGEMERMRGSEGAAPDYDEAMALARRGLAAEAIAERCGISVAEAALVRSLIQGGRPHPGEAA